MVEKIGRVSNPLTIIAIFAGLAEISGTIVLPLLSEENQKIFLWYVMFFPSVLVSWFFITLLCKHKVLYSPGDFRDDENFLHMAGVHKKSVIENSESDNNVSYSLGSWSDNN